MKALICIFAALVLAGCAGQAAPPPPAKLAKPSPRLMVPPQDLPEVLTGADSYQSDAQCSIQYVEETEKLRSLQSWVATIHKRK